MALTIGMVLPRDAEIQIIALNGEPVTPQLVQTARGLEARVKVRRAPVATLLGTIRYRDTSPEGRRGLRQARTSQAQPVRWSKSPRTQAM